MDVKIQVPVEHWGVNVIYEPSPPSCYYCCYCYFDRLGELLGHWTTYTQYYLIHLFTFTVQIPLKPAMLSALHSHSSKIK